MTSGASCTWSQPSSQSPLSWNDGVSGKDRRARPGNGPAATVGLGDGDRDVPTDRADQQVPPSLHALVRPALTEDVAAVQLDAVRAARSGGHDRAQDPVAVVASGGDVRGVPPAGGVHDVGEVDVGLQEQGLAEELAALPLPADGVAADCHLAGLWRVLV